MSAPRSNNLLVYDSSVHYSFVNVLVVRRRQCQTKSQLQVTGDEGGKSQQKMQKIENHLFALKSNSIKLHNEVGY